MFAFVFVHLYIVFVFLYLFIVFVLLYLRWSERMNLLLQTGH